MWKREREKLFREMESESQGGNRSEKWILFVSLLKRAEFLFHLQQQEKQTFMKEIVNFKF